MPPGATAASEASITSAFPGPTNTKSNFAPRSIGARETSKVSVAPLARASSRRDATRSAPATRDEPDRELTRRTESDGEERSRGLVGAPPKGLHDGRQGLDERRLLVAHAGRGIPRVPREVPGGDPEELRHAARIECRRTPLPAVDRAAGPALLAVPARRMVVRDDPVAGREILDAAPDLDDLTRDFVAEDGAGFPADVPAQEIGAADPHGARPDERFARPDPRNGRVDDRDAAVGGDLHGSHCRRRLTGEPRTGRRRVPPAPRENAAGPKASLAR